MAKKTIEMIVKNWLKWHKAEVTVLWFLIAIGAIPIPAGIGVCFCVDGLAITQYVFAIPAKSFAVSQVKMLCNFAKVLGIVFALAGIAVIYKKHRIKLNSLLYS